MADHVSETCKPSGGRVGSKGPSHRDYELPRNIYLKWTEYPEHEP